MNVVITGATKGIGLAMAHAFARAGCNLAVCSRNEGDLENLHRQFAATYPGIEVLAKTADLARRADVFDFADWVQHHWSSLAGLVNNAGLYRPGTVIDEPDDALEQLLAINLYGPFHLTRKLLPLMKGSEKAHIFNICSVAGLSPYPESGLYSISKFALVGFSRVLRDELRDTGIKVTSVYPGATQNSMASGLADGHIMPAEDVAQAVISAWSMQPASVVEDLVIRPQFGHL